MMKLGKNGEVLSTYSSNIHEPANAIVMDVLVKSAVYKGIVVNTLDECYLIRQSFITAKEIHDYYAYRLADGSSVLLKGADGMYSVLSDELYSQLVASFLSNK